MDTHAHVIYESACYSIHVCPPMSHMTLFHGGNRGSNPLGDAKVANGLRKSAAIGSVPPGSPLTSPMAARSNTRRKWRRTRAPEPRSSTTVRRSGSHRTRSSAPPVGGEPGLDVREPIGRSRPPEAIPEAPIALPAPKPSSTRPSLLAPPDLVAGAFCFRSRLGLSPVRSGISRRSPRPA
jgi:hypothetical protein